MALGGAASKAATSGSTVSTVVNGDGTLSLVGAAGAEGALEAFAATFQGVLTDFGVVKNIQNDWDSLMEALNSKKTRMGTYDANLNRIGD